MNLVPWRRSTHLDAFRNEFDELLNRFFSGQNSSVLPATFTQSKVPAVNFSETEKSWNISFELPGLELKDIHVQLIGQSLVVSGERKWDSEQKNKEFHRVESQYGSFQRSVVLPENVRLDPDSIVATYKRGMLEVTLPKIEATPTVKIPVKAG